MSTRERLFDLYYLLLWLLPLNLVWALLTLPIITAFPALFGLVYATNRLAHNDGVSWQTLLVGFRRYFWVSWRWGVLNVCVYGLLLWNAQFYGWQVASPLGNWLQVLFVAMVVFWTIVQLHVLPLLIEQEEPKLRLALRNAWVLLVKATRRSGILLFSALVIVMGTALLIPIATLFFSASVLAYVANRETILAIAESRATPHSDS